MHARLLSHYQVFGKQLFRDFQSWSWHPNYAVYSTLFQGASGSLKHLAAGVPWLKGSLDEEFTIQMSSNCLCIFREDTHSPLLFQKWNILEKKKSLNPFYSLQRIYMRSPESQNMFSSIRLHCCKHSFSLNFCCTSGEGRWILLFYFFSVS